MALVWVVCGAGRGVGKSTLAQRLRVALPDALYAKRGHGPKQAGMPDNLFNTDEALANFIERHADACEHLVIESNGMALREQGDIRIFIDGMHTRTRARDDVDKLAARAHIQVSSAARPENWAAFLSGKLESTRQVNAVIEALKDQQNFVKYLASGLIPIEPLRISTVNAAAAPDPCAVVREEIVTIMVEQVGAFSIMCTPCDVKALALGFLFSEGLIASIDDVLDYSYNQEQQTIGVRLDDPGGQGDAPRNLIVTSSCGLCGNRNIDRLFSGDAACKDTLRVKPPVLKTAVDLMYERQTLFSRTGGSHAAGIFDSQGHLKSLAEDIGRHSALDKAVGLCLMRDSSAAGQGAVVSGRVSLEIVAKSIRAGMEIIVAVSAPSALAVRAAERCNITLCGFVRADRATIYTHPRRILELPQS